MCQNHFQGMEKALWVPKEGGVEAVEGEEREEKKERGHCPLMKTRKVENTWAPSALALAMKPTGFPVENTRFPAPTETTRSALCIMPLHGSSTMECDEGTKPGQSWGSLYIMPMKGHALLVSIWHMQENTACIVSEFPCSKAVRCRSQNLANGCMARRVLTLWQTLIKS
jgi:hypothetical protein